MDAINRTLKYVDLYLTKDLNDITEYKLPLGYKFVYFKPGDETSWVNIELSSGEFVSFEEGMEAFNYYYGSCYDKLKDFCLFIENSEGEKVATATAFYLDEPIDDITGNVHWVSIKQEYQGMHLSKPLITEVLKQLKRLGHKKTILHTQTHTWLACKVYLDMGFIPYNINDSYLGWQIIKKITNHAVLKDISNIDENDMYNPLYVKAYEFLKSRYNEPFNYKVWDLKGPIIGINHNNEVHFYKYELSDNDLMVEEIGENYGKAFNKRS